MTKYAKAAGVLVAGFLLAVAGSGEKAEAADCQALLASFNAAVQARSVESAKKHGLLV